MNKTKKETKITRFVQIGEKRNGRIYKNEQYKLDEFILGLLPTKIQKSSIKISKFDRVFNTNKYKKYLFEMTNFDTFCANIDYLYDIEQLINTLIDEDTTTQTKRRNK